MNLSRLSPYGLWLFLSLPAVAILAQLASTGGRVGDDSEILHISGELSAWLLITAMLASPLALILRGRRWPRWMLRNRRYLGVAAFGYATLHTLIYLLDRENISAVAMELTQFDIWTGWIAFLLFVPLAVSSTDRAVRQMGRRWKNLQRGVYVAAILTLLHWASLNDWSGIAPALIFFGPLGALEAYRFWYWNLRPRVDRGAGPSARVL